MSSKGMRTFLCTEHKSSSLERVDLPNTLERPSASRSYEPLMKKLACYDLIMLDELGGLGRLMDGASTCIRQPRNRLGDADKC